MYARTRTRTYEHARMHACTDEGDALFLPKGWHHAVISSAQNARNIAVNLWFDLDGSPEAKRQSSLSDMFQATGC